MKIYTRTGDQGATGLWGGRRLSKADIRIQAYGTVDECNAVLGLARTCAPPARLDATLQAIQNQLFVLGSDLASEHDNAQVPRIGPAMVTALEDAIDQFEADLPPLTQFILPGGTPLAAQLHLARTVCRRAERLTVELQSHETLNPQTVIYLNRLSDWLFVAARWANFVAGKADVPWQKPAEA